MKFSSAIVAGALLRCIHSAEAATPKLRANTIDEADNAAEVVVDAESKHTARERISKYVTEGQMFYILDSQPVLYEDPSKAPFPFTNVFWFCQPVVAPDNNGDGMYDSVVSHVNIYMPASTSSQGTAAGASNINGGSNNGIAKPFFATDGYNASWVESGKYYDEKVVDFGDFTVTEMKGKEFQMYETSAPGTSGGLVMCK